MRDRLYEDEVMCVKADDYLTVVTVSWAGSAPSFHIFPADVKMPSHQIKEEGVQTSAKSHWWQDPQANPVGTPEDLLLHVLDILQRRRRQNKTAQRTPSLNCFSWFGS